MTPHPKTITWLRPTLTSLALVCAASLGQAQTAQDYIVSQFDDGTTQGWARNYGGAATTITNSPDMNRGPVGAGPGALNMTAAFDLCTLGGNNQTDWEKVLSAPLDLTKYTRLHFSVYVDTNSAHLSDWGAGQLGPIRPHIRLSSWGGDVSINPSSDSQWIGTGNYGTWMDYSMPIDQTVAANLPTLQACGVLGLQMWSGWGTCAAPIGLTNTISIWMDNIWFEWNTNTAPPPPPTTGLSKAGKSGVMIALGTVGGQWDRQAISTPAPDTAYIWTAQGGYPVSYSCTITDFPPVGTHLGYEAHMYIANGDTAGSGNNTSGSPDWNCPDILIFRVENHATTTTTTNGTTITTNTTYDAMAQIQWKTNYPAANSTNIPVVAFAPGVVGTWTVTFADATHGSLSGPGLTATNFTLPADAVAANFSPATSFVQFGNFKNDGANDGHNDNASGTFSHVKISGTAAPIDDDLSGATLTNKYAWRVTSANEVQYIAPGTAWFFNWSVPAFGFNPYVASSILGPWTPLALASQYQNGTNIIGAVAASALPAGGNAFFRMVKYPFVKLQVLMPGETAAPNTPTGKTGTPTAQTAGLPFNITVNAVDQFWNVSQSSDEIAITCSDASASLPLNATLVGGTKTFSVTFGSVSAPGTWTVTATDVTDGTKTANTGSPTIAQ
jgi:hypothetical protein